MALSKKYRLRSSSLIDLAYQKGAFYKTPFFRVQYRKTLFSPRIAFVVSKKIDTRAVVRNMLKRKVSAAFAMLKPSWEHLSYDMVVSIFEASKTASFEDIIRAIQKTLKSLSV